MHTNIVICGGALAGMTLALSLQSKGFNIVIIDPRDTKEVIEQDKKVFSEMLITIKRYEKFEDYDNTFLPISNSSC